jgi:hypothetical protein
MNSEHGIMRKEPLQREKYVSRRNIVFIYVVPCSVVEGYRHVGGLLVNICHSA